MNRSLQGMTRGGDQLQELMRMVKSGECLAATRRFDLIKADLSPASLPKAYHLVSVAYYQLGNLFSARECAKRAADLGQDNADTKTVLLAWMNLIDIENHLSGPADALQYARKWLTKAAILAPDMEARFSGRVFYNMALAYRAQRDYVNALKYLDMALPILRDKDSISNVISCLQMQAWFRYELGETAEADQAFQATEEVLELVPDDKEARFEQILLKAWRAHWMDDSKQATNLSEEIVHNPNLTHIQRGWACWIAAQQAVKLYPSAPPEEAARLKTSALGLAESCLTEATQAKSSHLINRANVLRREAFSLGTELDNQAG